MPATRDWFIGATSGLASDESLAALLREFPEARAQAETEAKELGLDPRLLFSEDSSENHFQRLKAADRQAWQLLFSQTLPVVDSLCEMRSIGNIERRWGATSRVLAHLPDLVARSDSAGDLVFLIYASTYYSIEEELGERYLPTPRETCSPVSSILREFSNSLGRLPTCDRKVLKYYIFEAKSPNDIADRLRIPREKVTDTLQNAIRGARERLRGADALFWAHPVQEREGPNRRNISPKSSEG
jgi:hypothetical protein